MSDKEDSLVEKLKRLRPDLFDEDGELQPARVRALLLEATGGKKFLTKADVIALGRPKK
jgi:hypothetical protein